MKKLAIILLTATSALGASAQDIFDNPDNHTYLGVRLGLDVVCPGDVKNDKLAIDLFNNGVGFDAGAVLNIPLWKNLYFEPGLSIYYNAIGIDAEITDYSYGYVGSSKASISVRRFGFRMPFRAGYRFDFDPVSVSVFTGPRLEIGLVGREHVSYNGSSEGIYGHDGLMNRVDIGWQFGAGVTYGRYVFEIAGTVGMLDMNPSEASYHESNVSFTVGYNF